MMRHPRRHCEAHLKFIGTLPCLLCLDNTSTEAAHVKFAEPRAAKRYTGIAEKSDDAWTVPLCGKHHTEQHGMNEREFWTYAGVDPIFTALALWNATGDAERAEQIVIASRQR